MPTWPSSDIDTTDLDAGTDVPATARADLKEAVDNINTIRAARGVADGIASLDASGKVPVAQLPVTPVASGVEVKSTPGAFTWDVPAGVTRVRVRAAGGGGGGGYTSVGTGGDHGGGGGAGGYAEKYFTVVPGSTFTGTIGGGGAGHASSSDGDGADGGDTDVTSPASATPPSATVNADGGAGGKGPTDCFGGAGGAASGGDVNLAGGTGVSGATRGGAGGSNALSGGAAGATGYGGGGGFGSGGGTDAFDGLDGCVIFEW